MKWIIILISIVPKLSLGQLAFTVVNTNTSYPIERNTLNSTSSIVSFESIRGMMHVKARVDGQEGNFILDTGAPVLVINCKEPRTRAKKANSVVGNVDVALLQVDQFQWAGSRHTEVEALAVDISHLEKAAKREILGLIGYDNLKDYELYINPKQQKLHFICPRGE